MVLKRVPLGSQMEEFLIPGREAVDEKNFKFLLLVYSTHKKVHSEVELDGNVYSSQGKAA